MARVFLHVGAHKTGTSYLQAIFDANRALLARHGIIYPYTGPNNAHHALAAPWLGMPDIPDSFFGSGGRSGPWDLLIDRYAKAPGTVFLSAENFTRIRPERVDMAQLAHKLSAFEEVRIVYTMRQQVDLVQSLWMQVAKSVHVPTLRKYVENAFEERRGEGVPIDHSSVYARLLEGFAPEEICLFDYNSMRRAPGGIVGSFLRLMDSDLDPAALQPLASDASANVSPDPIALYVATQITQGTVPPANLVELIKETLRPEGAPPATLLTRAEYNKMRNKFVHSNETLAKKVRAVQPDFLFDPGKVPRNLFCRDDLTAEHWRQVACALYSADPSQTGQGSSLLKRLLLAT